MWPTIPLVAEWRTRSTPWASGVCPSGVANVESTTVKALPIAPRASRSTRSNRGLAGVSANTSIVLPGTTAAANASGSVPSTKVTSMPSRGQAVWKNSWVPAYSWRWVTMWSPDEQTASTTVLIAPMPEAKARAASPPSNSAMVSSKARTVGFPYRL